MSSYFNTSFKEEELGKTLNANASKIEDYFNKDSSSDEEDESFIVVEHQENNKIAPQKQPKNSLLEPSTPISTTDAIKAALHDFENYVYTGVGSNQKQTDSKVIQLFEKCLGALPELSEFDDFVAKNPRKFRWMLRNGIPTQELRVAIWKRLAGSHTFTQNYHSQLYVKLVEQENDASSSLILRDVHRTFPQYAYFAEKNGKGQTALYNILKAFSNFDKQVGYVQGMPFIVGHFAMHMPEESCFWILVQLMNSKKHNMKDVYRAGLPYLRLLLYMIDELIKSNVPDVHIHMMKESILPEIFASPFVLTLGANRFQFEVAERMIDIFMYEGWKIIVRFVVGIFKFYKEKVIKLGTAEVVPFINDLCDKMDVATMLKVAFCVKLSTKTIRMLAEQYEKTVLSPKEKDLIEKHRKNRQKLLANQKKAQQSKPPVIATVQPDYEFESRLFTLTDDEIRNSSIN